MTDSIATRSLRSIAVALAFALSGCATTPEPVPPPTGAADDPARVEAEVIAALERYYRIFSARDWDAFPSCFWPGATLTTIWQPPGEDAPRVVTTTVPEFLVQAPSGPGSKPIFHEAMTGAETRIEGDLAHVWATYEA
jgi:hypothetical protein